MGTYIVFACLLLTLSRSGAQFQAPSMAEFATFCNEVGTLGSPLSPFLEVLCRQVAERADTKPPPSAATSWTEVEAFSVTEQAPNITSDLGINFSTQQEEQVTTTQVNYTAVIPREANATSDYQSRGNETLIADNAFAAADIVTDTFRVGGGQTIIILNNTLPQKQIDLEVDGGLDFSSNVEVATATTGEPNKGSTLSPETKFLHIVPHNESTYYVDERVEGELAGGDFRNGTINSTRAFHEPIINLKTLKRGDQMPVPDNVSGASPSNQEISQNQTHNNADSFGQLPEAGPQQSLAEEGLLIQQSDVQKSNETLNANRSTDVLHIVDKEQTNMPADRLATTVDSQTEGQVFVEQRSTITGSEMEAPVSPEVAKDGLYSSSATSSVTGLEIQGTGHGSTANGPSTNSGIQINDVNNTRQVVTDDAGEPEIINVESSTLGEFSEVEPSISENIATQVVDTTQSTLLGEHPKFSTLGNDQETSGGQSIVDQYLENVTHERGAVDTQAAEAQIGYTLKVEPLEEKKETNIVTRQLVTMSTESTVVDSENPAHAIDKGTKEQSLAASGGNLGYEVWSTSGELSLVSDSNNMESEQSLLSNTQNKAEGASHTLVAEPSENFGIKSETLSSQPFVVDLSTQAPPENAEESGPAGLNDQQASQDSISTEGASSSNQDIKSTTQNRLSGNNLNSSPTSTGSTVGVASSERTSFATTSLPPTTVQHFVRDSILVLKEVSTELLDGLGDVHSRQSLNEFWKNVTETFREALRRVFASREPTVRDLMASVTEVIESYRRESPYWKTIAANLGEATSEWRWRQRYASVAELHCCDRAGQRRLMSVLQELCRSVRASLSNPQCRVAGAQPAEDSCDQFVLCYRAGWQWRAQTLHCPRGTAFSRSERHCVWWPFADCRPTPSTGHRDDDHDDSSSDSSDSDSDSSESEERSWSLFRHGRSLFRMFDFRH